MYNVPQWKLNFVELLVKGIKTTSKSRLETLESLEESFGLSTHLVNFGPRKNMVRNYSKSILKKIGPSLNPVEANAFAYIRELFQKVSAFLCSFFDIHHHKNVKWFRKWGSEKRGGRGGGSISIQFLLHTTHWHVLRRYSIKTFWKICELYDGRIECLYTGCNELNVCVTQGVR